MAKKFKQGHIYCKYPGCNMHGMPDTIRKHKAELGHGPNKVGRPKKSKDVQKDDSKEHLVDVGSTVGALGQVETNVVDAVVDAAKPAVVKRKKKKAGFNRAEPSYVINQFSWTATNLDQDEALDLMYCPQFWTDCIENGLDPLWAYRYLRWRLGHPRLQEWRHMVTIPGPGLCIEVALKYVASNYMDIDDAEADAGRAKAVNVCAKQIHSMGRSFGAFPMKPGVCAWKAGKAVQKLAQD